MDALIDKDPQVAVLRAQLKLLEYGSATRRRALEQKWEEYKPEEARVIAAAEAAIKADREGYERIKQAEASMHHDLGTLYLEHRPAVSPPRRIISAKDLKEHKDKMAKLRRLENTRTIPILVEPKPAISRY